LIRPVVIVVFAWLIVAWSLQLAANYPKETGMQSRLIGFEDASSPMSQALYPDPPQAQ
jgi:hypothetical protein